MSKPWRALGYVIVRSLSGGIPFTTALHRLGNAMSSFSPNNSNPVTAAVHGVAPRQTG